MMAAKKNKYAPKGSLVRLGHDFSEGAACEGFLLREGSLVRGKAAALYRGEAGAFTFAEGCAPEALYFLRTHAGICAAAYAAGKLYRCAGDGGAFADTGMTFSAPPACARLYDGEEKLALSDGEKVCLLSAGGVSACADIPAFSAAGYAYDRLWIAEKGSACARVRFSALMNVHDFEEEGGYIDFPDVRGAVIAFAEAEGGFYLVREAGVQKLAAAGGGEDFALKDVFAPVCKIYAGTVCCENGRLYFLTSGGMYVLGGGRAEPFYPDYAPLLSRPGEDARAVACGGRVFLSADTEEGGVTAVFAEDGSGALLMRGQRAALSCIPARDGAAACFYADGQLRLLAGAEGCLPGRWRAKAESPFGGAPAVLEEISLTAAGDFCITAESEWGSRTFELCMRGETRRLRTALRGSRFRFTIAARGEGRVDALTAGYSRAG